MNQFKCKRKYIIKKYIVHFYYFKIMIIFYYASFYLFEKYFIAN